MVPKRYLTGMEAPIIPKVAYELLITGRYGLETINICLSQKRSHSLGELASVRTDIYDCPDVMIAYPIRPRTPTKLIPGPLQQAFHACLEWIHVAQRSIA